MFPENDRTVAECSRTDGGLFGHGKVQKVFGEHKPTSQRELDDGSIARRTGHGGASPRPTIHADPYRVGKRHVRHLFSGTTVPHPTAAGELPRFGARECRLNCRTRIAELHRYGRWRKMSPAVVPCRLDFVSRSKVRFTQIRGSGGLSETRTARFHQMIVLPLMSRRRPSSPDVLSLIRFTGGGDAAVTACAAVLHRGAGGSFGRRRPRRRHLPAGDCGTPRSERRRPAAPATLLAGAPRRCCADPATLAGSTRSTGGS